MNKTLTDRSGLLMILVLSLAMVGTCWTCWYFKTHQRIGNPGVKIVAGNLFNEKGELVRTNQVALPENLLGSKSEVWPITIQELEWLPPDTTYGRRRYVPKDGSLVSDMNVVVMEKDRTSIHKPQYCLPGGGFNITKEETISLPIKLKNGKDLQAQLIHATQDLHLKDGQVQTIKALFIYYFIAEGQTTPDHVDMLWRISRDQILKGVTERWGYVSIMTRFLPGNEERALEWTKELLKEAVPTFQLPVDS